MDTESLRKIQETSISFNISEAVPVNDLTGKNLPAALNTGIANVDFGHAQLLSCITSLRKLCLNPANNSCNICCRMQQGNCEASLIGLLGDLLIFILDHFQAEEKAMRDSLLYMLDRHVCEAHMEDHAQISLKIQQIVAAIDQSKTIELVRELDLLLGRWISNHVVLHDQALERWMMRQEFLSHAKKA